jgi:hypothetical protein
MEALTASLRPSLEKLRKWFFDNQLRISCGSVILSIPSGGAGCRALFQEPVIRCDRTYLTPNPCPLPGTPNPSFEKSLNRSGDDFDNVRRGL